MESEQGKTITSGISNDSCSESLVSAPSLSRDSWNADFDYAHSNYLDSSRRLKSKHYSRKDVLAARKSGRSIITSDGVYLYDETLFSEYDFRKVLVSDSDRELVKMLWNVLVICPQRYSEMPVIEIERCLKSEDMLNHELQSLRYNFWYLYDLWSAGGRNFVLEDVYSPVCSRGDFIVYLSDPLVVIWFLKRGVAHDLCIRNLTSRLLERFSEFVEMKLNTGDTNRDDKVIKSLISIYKILNAQSGPMRHEHIHLTANAKDIKMNKSDNDMIHDVLNGSVVKDAEAARLKLQKELDELDQSKKEPITTVFDDDPNIKGV